MENSGDGERRAENRRKRGKVKRQKVWIPDLSVMTGGKDLNPCGCDPLRGKLEKQSQFGMRPNERKRII